MIDYGTNWGMIGHEWAVELLAGRVASGRIGHAYLFTGPPSSGRAILATRLAQAVNCVGDMPPCGLCRPCDMIARGVHPDLHRVQPDGRYIKIEQIRELQSDLTLRPLEVRYRVAIIEDFQKVPPNQNAADAMLKTLEEPPTDTLIFLTANATGSLLETIVSRCQTIPLRPVSAARIEAALIARFALSPADAATCARLAGGRPGVALRLAQDEAEQERRTAAITELLDTLRQNRSGRFAYVESIYKAEPDDLEERLALWQSWWRDVMLIITGSQVTPVNVDQLDALHRLSQQILPSEARQALQAVLSTQQAISQNANTRLALDVMMLKMPFLR